LYNPQIILYRTGGEIGAQQSAAFDRLPTGVSFADRVPLMKEPHQGPTDKYLVTRAVTPSEAPKEVREMAEGSLGDVGLKFDEISFIAEVLISRNRFRFPSGCSAPHGPTAIRDGRSNQRFLGLRLPPLRYR
jgi:hypothetical protein